jgi:LPS-assembly lipoprotein
MWSSEPRLQRRRLGALLLAALPALAGCNLRPVYGPQARAELVPQLAAIGVADLGGSRGQHFRNYLIDELNPSGTVVAPRYDLAVQLLEEQTDLAIQLDDTATRRNLTLGAVFTLTRKSDAQVIYSSATRRVVSFNVNRDPFATMIAEQDAQRRAAREVARQIRTMLSLYFTEQQA